MVKKLAISSSLLELAELLRSRRAELSPNFLGKDEIPTELSVPITAEIREHMGYTWLQRQPSCVTAKELFENSLKRVDGKPWGYFPGEFDFTELVALFVGSQLSNLEWEPTNISAELKDKAIDKAQDLKELTIQGATLSRPTEAESLKSSLEDLISELTATPRPYTGADAAQRTILRSFSFSLLLRLVSVERRELPTRQVVEIVEAIAPLFRFSPAKRTVERYARFAASKYRAQAESANVTGG